MKQRSGTVNTACARQKIVVPRFFRRAEEVRPFDNLASFVSGVCTPRYVA